MLYQNKGKDNCSHCCWQICINYKTENTIARIY